MHDVAEAAQTIANFLQTFIAGGGFRLRFRVKHRGAPSPPSPANGSAPAETESSPQSPTGNLYVEFTGPDTAILTARNGEVLHALEHIAAGIIRLAPDENDRISFDADHFKANRQRQLRERADAAIERVRTSGHAHAFPPMSSRERRDLHMLLAQSGLPTASSGEGPQRFVVLYPEGTDITAPLVVPQPAHQFERQPERRRDPEAVRKAFRPR